jgi:N-acetylmuramoyl-L-alanine amidase
MRAVTVIWSASILLVSSALPGPMAGGQPGDQQVQVVAIDIGHSRLKPGATSASGESEFQFNLRMARDLNDVLEQGAIAKPVLINSDGRMDSLERRTRDARTGGAGLLLSIHHDSVQPRYLKTRRIGGKRQPYSDKFRGFALFVSRRSKEWTRSLELARNLGGELRRAGFVPTLHHAEKIPGEGRLLLDAELGIYRFDDLVVLRSAVMPAVLIECGVIVNPAEEKLLVTRQHRHQFVAAVARALTKFLRQ